MNDRRWAIMFRATNKNRNRHTLLNVKNIFIPSTVGRLPVLLRAAVKVEDENLIEVSQQRLTHSPKSRVVEETVVGDHGHDALPGLHNSPLCKTQELHIVVR